MRHTSDLKNCLIVDLLTALTKHGVISTSDFVVVMHRLGLRCNFYLQFLVLFDGIIESISVNLKRIVSCSRVWKASTALSIVFVILYSLSIRRPAN